MTQHLEDTFTCIFNTRFLKLKIILTQFLISTLQNPPPTCYGLSVCDPPKIIYWWFYSQCGVLGSGSLGGIRFGWGYAGGYSPCLRDGIIAYVRRRDTRSFSFHHVRTQSSGLWMHRRKLLLEARERAPIRANPRWYPDLELSGSRTPRKCISVV